MKKDKKEEIWQEVKHEIKENFDAIKDYEENIKKDYESKMNMPISDDDMLDICGHGQEQEYLELYIMKIKYVLIFKYLPVLSYHQIRRGISMPECLLDVCDINHSGVEDYTPEYIQRISREGSGQGKRNKQ